MIPLPRLLILSCGLLCSSPLPAGTVPPQVQRATPALEGRAATETAGPSQARELTHPCIPRVRAVEPVGCLRPGEGSLTLIGTCFGASPAGQRVGIQAEGKAIQPVAHSSWSDTKVTVDLSALSTLAPGTKATVGLVAMTAKAPTFVSPGIPVAICGVGRSAGDAPSQRTKKTVEPAAKTGSLGTASPAKQADGMAVSTRTSRRALAKGPLFSCSIQGPMLWVIPYAEEKVLSWSFLGGATTDDTFAKVKVTLEFWHWTGAGDSFMLSGLDDREFDNMGQYNWPVTFTYVKSTDLREGHGCFFHEEFQPPHYSCKFKVTADVRYQKNLAEGPLVKPPYNADPWQQGGHCEAVTSFAMWAQGYKPR